MISRTNVNLEREGRAKETKVRIALKKELDLGKVLRAHLLNLKRRLKND